MSARCTKAEKEKRILTIQGWIIDGAHDNLILRQIRNQWGINLRQARTYLKLAHNNWREEEEIMIEARRGSMIAELQKEKRSLKADYKGTPAGINAVARINKMIIKLQAIEPPRKHNIEINTAPIIKVVDVAKANKK